MKAYLAEKITYPRSRKSLIKFALLFHDITKPETRSDENGRIQFRGHEQSSAPVAARIARQMRLSRLEESIIQRIIAYHLQPGFMAHRPLSSREIYHYFKSVGDAAPEALILTYADRMAARGPRTTPSDFEMHRQLVSCLLTEYFEQEERPKLLTGQDIIRELHLEPGPHVGELLSMLDEAQAVGEVKTRQDATEFIHRIEATFKEQGINEIKLN
jgi:poly(A) polymerase